jgi:hypothetical protein
MLQIRIGEARVIKADIEARNGVIHVIDRVLLPPERPKRDRAAVVEKALTDAIKVGAPLYNAGYVDSCARVYGKTARDLLAGNDLRELHRALLEEALAGDHGSRDRAWALRGAFDRIFADLRFAPMNEAPLAEGFPGPGPVGQIVIKDYPRYRAALAKEGRQSFWMLFQHIKKNDVKMTAPVEMTMDGGMRERSMAFLYERPEQGATGRDGSVEVLDLEPVTVLSIAIRGKRDRAEMARAKKLLETALAERGLERAGDFRLMGYNSPFVPAGRQIWEMQAPVSR